MAKEFQYLQLSQVGCLIRDGKCLILEDAAHPGYWLIPGGRMDVGEVGNHEKTFKREIFEETGIQEFKILGIVDFDTWISAASGQPCAGIAYLIESSTKEIKLSPEHARALWVAPDELAAYTFRWRNAKRMILNGFKKNSELTPNV